MGRSAVCRSSSCAPLPLASSAAARTSMLSAVRSPDVHRPPASRYGMETRWRPNSRLRIWTRGSTPARVPPRATASGITRWPYVRATMPSQAQRCAMVPSVARRTNSSHACGSFQTPTRSGSTWPSPSPTAGPPDDSGGYRRMPDSAALMTLSWRWPPPAGRAAPGRRRRSDGRGRPGRPGPGRAPSWSGSRRRDPARWPERPPRP